MKHVLLIIMLLVLHCSNPGSNSKDGNLIISGHVYDQITNDPLSNIYIKLQRNDTQFLGMPNYTFIDSLRTDSVGYYSISHDEYNRERFELTFASTVPYDSNYIGLFFIYSKYKKEYESIESGTYNTKNVYMSATCFLKVTANINNPILIGDTLYISFLGGGGRYLYDDIKMNKITAESFLEADKYHHISWQVIRAGSTTIKYADSLFCKRWTTNNFNMTID